MKNNVKILIGVLSFVTFVTANANDIRKDATKFTKEKNKETTAILDFSDKRDFEEASRGFIATWPNDKILDANGKVVWDFASFNFIKQDGATPDTVNPSLWRQSRINNLHGLFEVKPGLYQVRGFDLSNITFMKGDKGWVVIDACTSAEAAKAAYELLKEKVEDLPITGLIITHSHADHFGGMTGLVTEEDIQSGKVKVVAPNNFFEASIAENVIVGNAMSRRATFMYGSLLPRDEKGTVDGGLGKAVSVGTVGILRPNVTITTTGEKTTVDGIELEFIMAEGTEAPSNFMFHIPKYNAFCPAEVANATLHNISTLRGAKSRDSLAWANALDEAYLAVLANKEDVMVAPHHWPIFGNDRIRERLAKHRDMYKYLHDQTIRFANAGYNPEEISEEIRIPDTLAKEFYNRGYYGTVSHNVKGVFDFYFGGWWDGKPANLHPLPPVESGKKYVELLGGEAKVISAAKKAFDKGEYRWTVELLSHVVLSNPKNTKARNLQADAMEQLGYQAESAPWRAYFLSGAQELRNGVVPVNVPKSASEDMLRVLPLRNFLDYLAVTVNPEKASGISEILNIKLLDTNENFSLELSNSVLKVREKADKNPTATLTISRDTINKLILKQTTLADQFASGNTKIDNIEVLTKIFGTFEEPNFWFNLVESNVGTTQRSATPFPEVKKNDEY